MLHLLIHFNKISLKMTFIIYLYTVDSFFFSKFLYIKFL